MANPSISVVLNNLPETASRAEIQDVFRQFSIPDGGIVMVGDRVFVTFNTNDDLINALRLRAVTIGGRQLEIEPISQHEMPLVGGRMNGDQCRAPEWDRGSWGRSRRGRGGKRNRSPSHEYSAPEMKRRGGGCGARGGFQTGQQPNRPKIYAYNRPDHALVLRVHNIAFGATVDDLLFHFHNFNPIKIKRVFTYHSGVIGNNTLLSTAAFIVFESEQDLINAWFNSGSYLMNRKVMIFESTIMEMQNALQSAPIPDGVVTEWNKYAYQNPLQNSNDQDDDSESKSTISQPSDNPTPQPLLRSASALDHQTPPSSEPYQTRSLTPLVKNSEAKTEESPPGAEKPSPESRSEMLVEVDKRYLRKLMAVVAAQNRGTLVAMHNFPLNVTYEWIGRVLKDYEINGDGLTKREGRDAMSVLQPFRNPEDALKAASDLNGKEIGGRQVTVFVVPKLE